jgi:predicted nucleic acid-binding protein
MKSSGADSYSRLVLDSTAYSHLRGGDQTVLDLVSEAEVVIMPTTVVGELEASFQLAPNLQENRSSLADFLAEPFVQVLQTTTEIARLYAEVFASLKRAGTPIPINDIWIAAAAMECRGNLVTFDWHFKLIENLDCIVLEDS